MSYQLTREAASNLSDALTMLQMDELRSSLARYEDMQSRLGHAHVGTQTDSSDEARSLQAEVIPSPNATLYRHIGQLSFVPLYGEGN